MQKDLQLMTKFNEERCAGILKSIKNRVPYKLSAQANGIHEDTLYSWINKGLDHTQCDMDTPYSRFAQNLKKIEEETMIEHLNKINDAVDRWQSHAWILERRWWRYFSPSAAIIELDKRIEKLTQQKGVFNNVESEGETAS